MVARLFFRSSWRFFTRHPWQLWLTLISISLGTAVIVSVDLANTTADRAFRQSVTTLTGPMTHEISAVDGAIPETFYTRLRVRDGYRASVPQVEGPVAIAGVYYTLLGVDPFAYLGLPGDVAALPPALPVNAISTLMTQPNSVVVSKAVARRFDVHAGQTLDVAIDGRKHSLTVVAILDDQAQPNLSNVMLADIATAQTLLGKTGELSRIQLILSDAQAKALRSRLPDGLVLTSYENRRQGFSQMTKAFRINLTAMSLLAVLVGAFLVYNTMTFSVLQRRQSFAIQRMIGVSGARLFRQLLFEALVLGIAGSGLGLVFGVILGQGLLVLVTHTISDLYVQVSATALMITPWLAFKGIGITLLAVFAATLAPALEAARVRPMIVYRGSKFEQGRGRIMVSLLLAGIVCMAASGLLIAGSGRSLIVGFVGLFVFIMGYCLMIPGVLRAVLGGLQRSPMVRNLNLRLTLRGVRASLNRTTLAIVALTVAVSATVGVSIMIGSFRASVADWLQATLRSDLYISARTQDSTRAQGTLDPRWLQRVKQLPGIASVSTGYDTTLEIDGTSVPLLVLQPGRQSARGFSFRAGEHEKIWGAFLRDRAVLVSEPFAYHYRLRRGDTLALNTARSGRVDFKVAGVFQDYSASQGMLVLRRDLYEQLWGEHGFSSIGLMLQDDADAAAVKAHLQDWAAQSEWPVVVRSNREIRKHSLAIFDRTFAITNVLRVLVVIVAFIGVFSALMALFLEKGREFAILRATGVSPARLRRLVLQESALIGLLAGLLSLPLGLIMSEILIAVINQRSFGWTMARHFSISVPGEALVLAIVAAVLAGLYPTWRISRVSVREGLNTL